MEKRQIENFLSEDVISQQYFSVREVAELLRVSPRYVTLLIKRKKLKGYKIGKEWRIPADVLREFVVSSFMKGKFKEENR